MNHLQKSLKDLLVENLTQGVDMKKIKKDKLIEKDKGFVDDSIVGIINLIHGQIHAELQYIQTKDEIWLKIAEGCRGDRTELMDLIVEGKNEEWCWCKHCLAWIGIYMELGSRCLSAKDYKLGEYYYNKAGKWLSVFYELNNL